MEIKYFTIRPGEYIGSIYAKRPISFLYLSYFMVVRTMKLRGRHIYQLYGNYVFHYKDGAINLLPAGNIMKITLGNKFKFKNNHLYVPILLIFKLKVKRYYGSK